MKKYILFFYCIVYSLSCYSQITYESGYFIDNSDKKITCLIKNIDWKNNPTQFKYKLEENAEPLNADIETIKEFGAVNTFKYVRSTVEIDRSSEYIRELDNNSEPIFSEEQLFLKVLIEGKADLYIYQDGNLKRFFYTKDNSNIEQLVYKKYSTSDKKVGQNYQFRQQLWNDLKCSTIRQNKLENLNYKKGELIKFFIEYNKCSSSKFINYEENQERELFNLNIRPRLNNSFLSLQSIAGDSGDIVFDSKFHIGFGLETEFILPFNKNKWSIIVEPTYQYYKSEKTIDDSKISGGQRKTMIEYSSLEIPLGLRHYFFLNEDSKIFANISFVFGVDINSNFEFKRKDDSVINEVAISNRNNLAFGVGYKMYDRYSLEMRYQTRRDILGNYVFWNSEYRTLSLIFGYSVF